MIATLTGYPAGQIELGVRNFASDTLRHWIDQRVGPPLSTDGIHIWDSVADIREISVGGSTSLAFDYVMTGPESPTTSTLSRWFCIRGLCS
jgi:hypothetical protein